MTTPVWIGLGSNLGDRKGTLDAAVAALAEAPGVVVRAVSSFQETVPVGGPPGQGAFLNAATRLDTTLDPHQLLAVLRRIEARAGRVRAVRWGERTLDLDILIFGTKFLDTDELKLPHPRLALRRFVLAPLAEIAPDIVDTMTRRTIADLLASLDRMPRLVVIHGPDGPRKSAVFDRLVEGLPGFGIASQNLEQSDDRIDETYSEYFNALLRQSEALKASGWEAENLRVPWIVTDFFFLGLEMHLSPKWMLGANSGLNHTFRTKAYHDGVKRARAAVSAALIPTFAVILPGDPEIRRSPGLSTVPLLWPDSDDPDAVVAEVAATCRSIAGG